MLLGALLPGVALAAGPSLSQLSESSSPLSTMGLLALLSLLPFAVVMLTSFSKIAVVLSLARAAMGTQQAPLPLAPPRLSHRWRASARH